MKTQKELMQGMSDKIAQLEKEITALKSDKLRADELADFPALFKAELAKSKELITNLYRG